MDPGMADPGFPDAHTTTTSTSVITNIRFDPSYIRTRVGIIKIVQLVLNIIAYLCITITSPAAHYVARSNWFSIVSMTGFWLTGILLIFYLMHVIEKLYKLPWLLIEHVYTAVMAFFYFTASLAIAVGGAYVEGWIVTAIFGFLAMIVYAVDTFFKRKDWRAGGIAQGERTVMEGVGNIQSPAAY